MTVVLIGTNRIENCETVIGLGPVPVLRVDADPVLIDLVLPDKASRPLRVERNEVARGEVRLIANAQDVTVLTLDGSLVFNATQIEPGTVAVHVDLRPFGLRIFTDAVGLHVGENVLAGNTIQGARTAIALG